MRKRHHEPATGSIDMDRDVHARLLLILVQYLAYRLHGLIMPRIRTPQNHKHPNRILIDILSHQIRIQAELALLRHRQHPRLHLKIPRKLQQRHLRIRPHNDIRLQRIQTLPPPPLLPPPLHRQPAQMNRLRRPHRRRADRLLPLLHAP